MTTVAGVQRPTSRRVAVTGLGPLSPRAAGCDAFRRLLACAPPVTADDLRPITDSVVAPQALVPRHMDALGRLAVTAAQLALADAGLEGGSPLEAMAIAFGSGYGCLAANLEYLRGIVARGLRFGNPVVFQNTVPNAATGYVSTAFGIQGPTATFSSGAVAGLEALDFCVQHILDGRAVAALVGSVDQVCAPIVEAFLCHDRLSAGGVARPLAVDRDGTVLSEGACAIVVEELGVARGRDAHVYAEIAGIGLGSHPGPEPSEALVAAIGAALRDAALEPRRIDVVFSGANGSLDTDFWESRGLWRALGEHAGRVPLSCPKSVLGETLGNGGTFALAAAALSLDGGTSSARACHLASDWESDAAAVAAAARRADVALVSVLGEGGTAIAVVLRRCA